MASVGYRIDSSLKRFKVNRKGIRQMMRSHAMQAALFAPALSIAQALNASNDGAYAAGPVGEDVTSLVGAHAFVRTEDLAAAYEQAWYDVLNKAL